MVAPAECEPGSDDVLVRLEEQVGLFHRRSRRFLRSFATAVHPGLDASTYAVLLVLAQLAPVRLIELAEEFGLDKSTMSRHVWTLIRLGLVDRHPDPMDGRAFHLRCTGEGRRRLDAVTRERRGEWRARLDGWSDAELAELVDALTRFNADLPG